MSDARRSAPSALRNRGPILEILRRELPPAGELLEIGSGTGEHAHHFARALPGILWHPSDLDPAARDSVEAWRAVAGLDNLRPCLALDARGERWPVSQVDAIVAINVIHISPWSVCEGIVSGARRHLKAGGLLFFYGPYLRGAETAASNAAFDRTLRARDPSWGVRELDAVAELCATHELDLARVCEMPRENLSLILRRR